MDLFIFSGGPSGGKKIYVFFYFQEGIVDELQNEIEDLKMYYDSRLKVFNEMETNYDVSVTCKCIYFYDFLYLSDFK